MDVVYCSTVIGSEDHERVSAYCSTHGIPVEFEDAENVGAVFWVGDQMIGTGSDSSTLRRVAAVARGAV